MEFALQNDIPNYAGGLGVLAADTMYSCADLGKNAVGVSLIYHQSDEAKKKFPLKKFLKKCNKSVFVKIENRFVELAIWKKEITIGKGVVPIFFLSADCEKNEKWDRDLTKNIYASDGYTRLCQEALLGIGGVRALEELGYTDIKQYHLNEGHCSFLTLELLRTNSYDENKVRSMCSFTTHTPLASGHDYFDYDLAYKTIGEMLPWDIRELATNDRLGMTELALNLSSRANAVSVKHGEVCRAMFPQHNISSVTNGICHFRWAGSAMQKVFNKRLAKWREAPAVFAQAEKLIPDSEVVKAHTLQKKELLKWINMHREFFPFENVSKSDYLMEDVLTIGFARRFVPYKRPELIFKHLAELQKIGNKKIQLIFSGHCGSTDQFCNATMNDIEKYAQSLRGNIKIVIVPDYNLDVSSRLVSGCDMWLNTPIPPQEASGTSGMKAALNGCLNISIADGWWIEGIEKFPQSGWAFGGKIVEAEKQDDSDADDLLIKLAEAIQCYYKNKKEWALRMKNSIALTSFFNTHRMVNEYFEKMWSK